MVPWCFDALGETLLCWGFSILTYLIGCPSAIIKNFNMPDNWQRIVSGADFGNHGGGGGFFQIAHTHPLGGR